MEIPLKKRFFYFFPVLFCFCLPFGSLLLSGIIIAWLISSVFCFEWSKFVTSIKEYNFLLMLAFFIITCLSAGFSTNKVEALTAVEIKMSFILLPYLLFCFDWPLQILRRCVISFVSGGFFTCLFLIVRATIYTLHGQEGYFFYTLFSFFIHPSYFAMYLILALTFVILFYNKWFKSQKTIVYSSYFFSLLFTACIFLCSSKIGLIGLFVCLPIIFLHKWRVNLNVKNTVLLLILFALLIFVSAKIFPDSFERLSSLTNLSTKNLDKTSSESTTVRVLIWEQCLNIIQNHFLFGTGVGDANDTLYKAYNDNGLTGALDHHLNAHSQFFQTFIGAGVFGLLILLLLTVGKLIEAILRRNVLLILFSVLIILNFAVESMLQTSAGVLFFTFFFCLFCKIDHKQLLVE